MLLVVVLKLKLCDGNWCRKATPASDHKVAAHTHANLSILSNGEDEILVAFRNHVFF